MHLCYMKNSSCVMVCVMCYTSRNIPTYISCSFNYVKSVWLIIVLLNFVKLGSSTLVNGS